MKIEWWSTSVLSGLCVLLAAWGQSSLGAAANGSRSWKEYSIPEYGFKVSLPSKPLNRALLVKLPNTDHVDFETEESTNPMVKYSIFVGRPLDRGIYDSESMDAYLAGSFQSIVKTTGGNHESSSRTTFRGLPALRYKMSFDYVDGKPYVARGVIFMIDGGHMRLSMLHPANDIAADEKFERFTGTFQLTPLSYVPALGVVNARSGVSFTPPANWIKGEPKDAQEVARYLNLTRALSLFVAGTRAYTCQTHMAALKVGAPALNVESVTLGGRPFRRITYPENVPAYDARLTIVHYCTDTAAGAIVLTAYEEESMFSRWLRVFDGVAASITAQ
jgi:hypothetical protein